MAVFIDPTALEQIRALGGKALVAELVGAALDSLRDQAHATTEAVARRDLHVVGESARAIASSAGTIGAHRLGDIACRLEQAADRGDARTCSATSSEIAAELAILEATLRDRFLVGPSATR